MSVDLAAYGLRALRPEVIDSSMLKDYVDCPSMFYLRHVLGLKKVIRDPTREAPLDWGTIWHKVMETWRNTLDTTQALQCLEPWPETVQAETDKHGRSQHRMIKIFFDYLEQFAEADQREFEYVRSEQFFDVYDEELDLRWCGRIDGFDRAVRHRRLQIRDFKTTSAMGSHYFEQHEHSFQMPGYVWGGSRLVTEPVEHVYLDVLYTLKGGHQFFRRTLHYPPERLTEWYRNVRIYMDRLRYQLDNDLENPEAWGKNWNQCTRYGLCSFADVHFLAAKGDTRLRVLANDYIEDRWDPRREEDGI